MCKQVMGRTLGIAVKVAADNDRQRSGKRSDAVEDQFGAVGLNLGIKIKMGIDAYQAMGCVMKFAQGALPGPFAFYEAAGNRRRGA